MNNYEGMFLFDPGILTDWESVQKEVNRLFERAGAEAVAVSRWDERRLAYEIAGRKRGVYVLTYFKADPTKIPGIERDVQLSESALRCLILRVDMTDEEMKEAASEARIEQQKNASFGDQGDDDDRGGFRRREADRDRDRGDRDRDRDRRRGEEGRGEAVQAAEPSSEE